MTDLLSTQEIEAGLAELDGWSRRGDTEIRAAYAAPDFLAGIGLVDAVARAAEAANHHPDIDIRYTTVTFTLSTHDAGGLTALDLSLAGAIAAAATAAGAQPA